MDALYEHFRCAVDGGQSPLRIDKYLVQKFASASRTSIQDAVATGCVRVNGIAVKASYRVKPRDSISLFRPQPRRVLELIPQDIPLDIVHEDDDLIVVNKRPGMVVHPGYGNYSGTLINALLHHFQGPSRRGDARRPVLLHRIDKNTSGLVVVAKNQEALNVLAPQFVGHTIERRYCAVVWGSVEADEGVIRAHIGHSLRGGKLRAAFADGSHGRRAVTHYRVRERLRHATLVECRLETGRTHQIRVHMQHIGHPLVNDPDYGSDGIDSGLAQAYFAICPRQALHAGTIGFVHPSGRRMSFEAELPDDMRALVGLL